MWGSVLDLALAGASAGGVAALVWAVRERIYVAVPPNQALVLYGRRARPSVGPGALSDGAAREPKILVGGGAYLAPWNKATGLLSLAPVDVEATVRAVHALEAGAADGWEASVRVQVKIPPEPSALRAAAENLLGLGPDELRSYVRRSVEAAVPAVLARIRAVDGEPDWERLGSEIQATVAPDLVTAGLIVRSVSVTELRRLAPTSRGERAPDPRRRPAMPVPAAGGAHPEGAELRLGRVERGLRSVAADLARLLRDEPLREPTEPVWLDAPASDAAAGVSHDSTVAGRAPGAGRTPWRSASDSEADP
jgi:hypothetical protein